MAEKDARRPIHATATEAQALNAVYAKLSELLNALRDARVRVRHEELSALLNEEVDRLLEVDTRLREAILDYTGKPVEDPY